MQCVCVQCLPAQLAAVQNAGYEKAAAIQAPPSGQIESAGPCAVPIGNNLQCGGNVSTDAFARLRMLSPAGPSVGACP